MIGKLAKKPYEGFKLYKVWHKVEKRWYAVLTSPGYRTTVSYAKYLAEVKAGRRLGRKIHAHHIDRERTNDVTGNIEILDGLVHHKVHGNGSIPRVVLMFCYECGKPFFKLKRKVRSSRSGFKFCNRSCGAKNQSKRKNLVA